MRLFQRPRRRTSPQLGATAGGAPGRGSGTPALAAGFAPWKAARVAEQWGPASMMQHLDTRLQLKETAPEVLMLARTVAHNGQLTEHLEISL